MLYTNANENLMESRSPWRTSFYFNFLVILGSNHIDEQSATMLCATLRYRCTSRSESPIDLRPLIWNSVAVPYTRHPCIARATTVSILSLHSLVSALDHRESHNSSGNAACRSCSLLNRKQLRTLSDNIGLQIFCRTTEIMCGSLIHGKQRKLGNFIFFRGIGSIF